MDEWHLRKCVFCESEGPLTDEDALPNWARKLLGGGTPVKVVRGKRDWKLRLVARQALCEHCNGVWLSSYENRFKRLMGDALINPARVEFDPPDQEFIALWTIKTALLLELAMRWQPDTPAIPLPTSVFHWLHKNKTPPPRSQVWFGATGTQPGERWIVAPYANETLSKHGSVWPVGNLITFALGHLVLKCAVTQLDPSNPGREWTPTPSLHFAQIWPVVSDPVVWPTPLAITQTEFATMSVRLWPIPVPQSPPEPWPAVPKVSDDWR